MFVVMVMTILERTNELIFFLDDPHFCFVLMGRYVVMSLCCVSFWLCFFDFGFDSGFDFDYLIL